MEEYNFFNMEQILEFLGIKHDFENKENKEYPFYDKPSDIIFSWGYITVERKGIEKEIQNKISSNGEYVSELKEINGIESIDSVYEEFLRKNYSEKLVDKIFFENAHSFFKKL